MKNFQKNFSKLQPHLEELFYNSESTHKLMAGKMIKICEEHTNNSLSDSLCLEIGTTTGYIAKYLSYKCKQVIGLDIDHTALEHAVRNNKMPNCGFIQADALRIPLETQSVDIIIGNSIYEHVPDAGILMKEIYRVLKNNGICYFGVANRLSMFWEPHYNLPFIAWLPRGLAGLILRITGKGNYYYETHLTYWGLLKMVCDFQIHDFTIKVLKNPRVYLIDKKIKFIGIFSKIPYFLLKLIYPLFPAYIWILTKRLNYSQKG